MESHSAGMGSAALSEMRILQLLQRVFKALAVRDVKLILSIVESPKKFETTLREVARLGELDIYSVEYVIFVTYLMPLLTKFDNLLGGEKIRHLGSGLFMDHVRPPNNKQIRVYQAMIARLLQLQFQKPGSLNTVRKKNNLYRHLSSVSRISVDRVEDLMATSLKLGSWPIEMIPAVK